MSDAASGRKVQTRSLFNVLASTYDATGCFAHFGRRLVDLADPRPGQRVLDVATGRGAVLFPAAERVGPSGEVVGIDLSDGMVRATTEEAERRGSSARLLVMDGERLEFPDAAFDRVLCGFGIMFFPNQAGALAEARRVLRPGGRIGLSTWQVAETEDLSAALHSLGLIAGPPPGWITQPEVLARLLGGAGFSGVQVTAETHVYHVADLDAYWQAARGTGQRPILDGLDESQTVQVRTALADRLRQHQQAGGFQIPARALLAVANG